MIPNPEVQKYASIIGIDDPCKVHKYDSCKKIEIKILPERNKDIIQNKLLTEFLTSFMPKLGAVEAFP